MDRVQTCLGYPKWPQRVFHGTNVYNVFNPCNTELESLLLARYEFMFCLMYIILAAFILTIDLGWTKVRHICFGRIFKCLAIQKKGFCHAQKKVGIFEYPEKMWVQTEKMHFLLVDVSLMSCCRHRNTSFLSTKRDNVKSPLKLRAEADSTWYNTQNIFEAKA
jgi:hypothetical protein